MACNCSKRNVVKQVVRKAAPRQMQQRHTSGKRIIRKVIRQNIYKVSKKTHSSSVGGMNCSILNEGLRNISAGTVDYTDGADVIPISRLSATKSEVHKSLVCGQFTNNNLKL